MTTDAASAHTIGDDLVVHPLDDPVRSSLRGVHAPFAVWSGRIGRYDDEVAGFIGHPSEFEHRDWADLAALVGPSVRVGLRGPYDPPADWEKIGQFASVQLDGSALEVAPEPDAEILDADDVPEILDLIARTDPGPFKVRTIEMGTYLGLRHEGRLIALAGERLHPEGWTEISAVCTDPAFRKRGLSTRLIRAVGHGIRERGEVPFLHARGDNHTAIRLYESLGFVLRKRSFITAVRTPALDTASA